MNTLSGMEIVVVPDDDDRVKYCGPDAIASDGIRFYVRESFWPKLKQSLDKQIKPSYYFRQ